MRGELNLICSKMELFEQFTGVAMAEDGICGEIVGCVHEMGLGCCCFSGSADSRLCIADDSVMNIDQTSLKQRRKGEDDRSGIASGVGNEAGLSDVVAV